MPTYELSKVNYNGDEYTIVDSTAEGKFSALGHKHTAADIIGGVDTVDYLTVNGTDYPIVSRRKGVLSATASDITGLWIDYTVNNSTQSIFLYDSAAIAYMQSEISGDIAAAKQEAIDDAAEKYSPIGHKHTVNDITDLAFDGTYNKTSNKVATVSTVNSAIASVTASTLGLEKALKFIGFATSEMSDSQTTIPTISGITGYVPAVGDVVIDSATEYEYIYTSANKWEKLGTDTAYVVSGTKINYTPEGTISNTGSTVNYTPTGSISTQSFHGTKGAVNVTGLTDGTVTITSPTATGTFNYVPGGTVTAEFSGSTGAVDVTGSVDGITLNKITPAGSVLTEGGSDTYIPEGNITNLSFSGTNGEYTGTFTPTGSISKPDITVTPTTTAADDITDWDAGEMFTTTIDGEKLILHDGAIPTLNYSGCTVITGVSAALANAPVFSATDQTITVSGVPTGTVTASFSGTGAKFVFSGTEVEPTIKNWGTVIASGSFTPTGSIINTTFAGSGVTLSASFVGKEIASTGSFTPTGTIDAATFSGDGAKLKFTGTATQLTIA